MNDYLFFTTGGFIVKKDSESLEPDLDTFEILGFGSGRDVQSAFESLLTESSSLLETLFYEIFVFKLTCEGHFTCI